MENKTGKYFKYAIGEILLVMIGILIALQINNWNENRKLQVKSYDYLKRLKVDLHDVARDVNGSYARAERRYNEALVALEVLEAKKLTPEKQESFEDHLAHHFKFQITIQSPPTYNEMVSSGDLGLIKNEWLRTALSNLSYRRTFLITINQSNLNAYNNNLELNRKYVRINHKKEGVNSLTSNITYNFDAMANDEFFVNEVSMRASSWLGISNRFKNYVREVRVVQDSIKAELKKYKE